MPDEVTVTLGREALESLKIISGGRNETPVQTLERIVGASELMAREAARGARILITGPNGDFQVNTFKQIG